MDSGNRSEAAAGAHKSNPDLILELESLRARLGESEEILSAIRSGEVDALLLDTPRGKAVFTLRGADRPYRLMMESMNQGALTLDAQGMILYGNRQMAEMLGIPLGRLIGDNFRHFVRFEDQAVFDLGIQRWEREQLEIELTLTCPDGTEVPVLLQASPLELDGTVSICALVSNRAELRRQEKLMASASLARQILEQSGQAIVICDQSGMITHCSRAARQLSTGHPIGRPFQEAYPLSWNDPKQAESTTVSAPFPASAPLQRVKAVLDLGDHGALPLLVNTDPTHDEAGQFSGWIVTLADITPVQQAFTQARASELNLHTLLDHAADFVFWLAPDRRFLYASPSALEITGYRREEFLADPSLREHIVHPDDLPRFLNHLENVERRHLAGDLEFRIVHPDSSIHWINHLCIPVFDAEGEFLGTRGANRDITQRKLMEFRLHKQMKSLEMLASSAQEFLEPVHDRPEQMMVDQISRLAGGALAVLSEHDPGANRLVIRAMAGPRELIGRLTELLGEPVTGMTFEVPQTFLSLYASGRLEMIQDGQPGATRALLPREVSETIGRVLGLADFYGLVLHLGNEFLGTVTLIPVSPLDQATFPIIEAFIQLGVLALKRNRTERELAESHERLEQRVHERTRELREASLYARSLIEASIDPLVTVNAAGRITDVNEATVQITGVSAEKLIGTEFAGYFTDPESARRGLTEVFQNGQVRDFQLVIRHLDGGERPVSFNATIYRNATGEIQGVFADARDLTEQQRIMERLRRNQSKLTAAQRIAAMGSWEWHPQSGRIEIFEELSHLLGMPPGSHEMPMTEFLAMVNPDDRPGLEQWMTGILRSGLATNLDFRIQRQDGQVRCAQVHGELLKNADGEPECLIGTLQDVTEKREHELKLIMTERLASLGQMASGIAHEINNPLATISTCTEGLLKRFAHQEFDLPLFETYLNIISQEVERCHKITSGMLAYVRCRTDERLPLDINSLIEKTIELLSIQGRLELIEFRRDLAAGLPRISCWEVELQQVILIIMMNALDAIGAKGWMEIGTGLDNGRLFIRIADSGPGIPGPHLGRIFEPFFTTKQRDGGTGLGLSIAHNLIVHNGGEIRVESPPGRGATFIISFPTA